MEHMSGLVEADTSGSACRLSNTGMEYSDGQMEEYIMDSTKRISVMVTDTQEILMAQNIMGNGRMAQNREMQL